MDNIKLALYGYAGSGKDYVAEHIISELSSKDNIELKRFAFADNLKKAVNSMLGFHSDFDGMTYNNENFKNNFYIDLESLEGFLMDNVPEETSKKGNFGETQHIMFCNPELYIIHEPFVIYTAKELFELCQRSSSCQRYSVIPNVVQSFTLDSILYPEWYNEKTMYSPRRLMSYREFIVWIGTYCFQNMINKNVWVNSVFNSVDYKEWMKDPEHGVIITDLRFPHEFDACKRNGFKIIKVHSNIKSDSVANVAESYYNTFYSDYTFLNSRDPKAFDDEMNNFRRNWLHDYIKYGE